MIGAIAAVEQTHLAIAGGIADRVPGGTLLMGATRFTYARVRDVAAVVRRGNEGLAALLGDARAPGADRRVGAGPLAWLAALNGAIGDHLEASANPLALPMSLCRDGDVLDARSARLQQAIDAAGGSIVLFVHGLGMNDLHWRGADGAGFGERLERDLPAHALQLRYNSGRRISANGRDLSLLLQALHESRTRLPRRLLLVGHSMGGLVCRSACEHARRHRLDWAGDLDAVACLGTPHRGAPLERVGSSFPRLLAATPVTRALAAVADVRSAGVKDLRAGWASDLDREDGAGTQAPCPLPFADRVRWHLVAATLAARSAGAVPEWIGDGLVPISSALAGTTARHRAALPEGSRTVFTRMGHMELTTDPRVYEQLHAWFAQG
ncbi:MAG: alpha/beta fold hydrolase [Dokdonella sp.]|uniref:alpha/beta fold hydrolase n=1 Tax=Dokdonella sp. TaxID=2291710 RepID=UPI003F7D5B11